MSEMKESSDLDGGVERQTGVYLRLKNLEDSQKTAWRRFAESTLEGRVSRWIRQGNDIFVSLPDNSVERTECLAILFLWCRKNFVEWKTNYRLDRCEGHPWRRRVDALEMGPDDDPEMLSEDLPSEPVVDGKTGILADRVRALLSKRVF
jgi:hypothetical protein